MTERFVRAGVISDAANIARIYNQGIADRIATFVTEPSTATQIEAWFAQDYPVVVSGRGDEIMAFAVAQPYRVAPHYHGVREFSVYAAREARGQGYGADALTGLSDLARERGCWKLVSRIFPENTASRALCARNGFREVGIYEKHGRLEGRWRDVVIVEKLLI
jgi:phosphinothricin acetyltransferase